MESTYCGTDQGPYKVRAESLDHTLQIDCCLSVTVGSTGYHRGTGGDGQAVLCGVTETS